MVMMMMFHDDENGDMMKFDFIFLQNLMYNVMAGNGVSRVFKFLLSIQNF